MVPAPDDRRPVPLQNGAGMASPGMRIAALILGVMALVELSGFIFPGFITRMAAIAWMLAGVAYVALSGFMILRTLARAIRELAFLGLMLFACWRPRPV